MLVSLCQTQDPFPQLWPKGFVDLIGYSARLKLLRFYHVFNYIAFFPSLLNYSCSPYHPAFLSAVATTFFFLPCLEHGET